MELEHSPRVGRAERESPRGPHAPRSSATATAAATSSTRRPPEDPAASGILRSGAGAVRRRCATATRRSSGSAATAASRCPTRCGATSSSAKDKKYSDNQAEHWSASPSSRGVRRMDRCASRHLSREGQGSARQYRAFGYEPPAHKWADVKLLWRDLSMRLGHAPAGSSPRAQHDLGLNRDDQLRPRQGRGPSPSQGLMIGCLHEP